MIKPKLILFDIGGVLIDYSRSFQTASKEQNIPIEDIDKVFDTHRYEKKITLGEVTPQEFYLKVREECNPKIDKEYDFVDSWIRDYRSIKPTYDFIIDIKDDFSIGLLSNIYKGIVSGIINNNLIPNIDYSFKFLSCDINKKKPEEDIYNYVEESTGLKGKDILFIDDREDYLTVPKQMKWTTFLFNMEDPQKSITELRCALGRD